MRKLSLFISNFSTSNDVNSSSLFDLLSGEHISALAQKTGACMRKRKFSFADFIHDALTRLSSSIRDSEYTLNSFNLYYNRHQSEGNRMSHKCIHR